MKRIRNVCFLVISLLIQFPVFAQSTYEPLHGVSGSDYDIKGELELNFSNAVDFKNGNKLEGTYRIKSPVVLSFNRNDLKFLKAKPNEFIGYVENQYDAKSGFTGGLFEIPQGGYGEEENWMQVESLFKSRENDQVMTVNAKGEIYPVLQVYFSIPDYAEKLKNGLTGLQFRVMIKGVADPKYHPQRKVTGSASFGPMNLTEGFDLPVSVGCGTFYGSDLAAALVKNNLVEADAAKKKEFEHQYEKEYFKGLPCIDALKLINFLIKPVGNYETPITGSFYSDSEFGTEKATYAGSLRLWGGQIKKNE